MKVSVIGTGYVGLVSGTCFAEIGHEVTCIDIDARKINLLQDGESPIYEPGLTDLLKRNIQNNRLKFSTEYSSCNDANTIFLAVGTPSGDDGAADLKYLKAAACSVAKEISKDGAVIVIKSTVPVGTCNEIRNLIKNETNFQFYLVNNPEFLKEGSAVEDFMRPDRVIIGSDSEFASKKMDELYSPLVAQGNPMYHMSNLSAEMSKYAANCFLATKISFMNEIAKLCDLTGSDVNQVRKGIGSDVRIGKHFLYPGPGYGGSCFPKDVKALVHTAKNHGMSLEIVNATEKVNDAQKTRMFDKIQDYFGKDLTGKKFAFWGVAFKANTDDVREASALYMAKALIEAGANVRYYDPVASNNFETMIDSMNIDNKKIEKCIDMYDVLDDCDGLITMTEWREFRAPDFEKIKETLKSSNLFDARNLYDTEKVLKLGFNYFAIGKYIPNQQ